MTDEDRGPAPTAEAAGAEPRRTRDAARRRGLSGLQQLLLLVALAVVGAVVLEAFVVESFSVPSESMEPALVQGDRILVSKLGGAPERGDVVVFEDPGGWLAPDEVVRPGPLAGLLARVGLAASGGHLVKRVVAVEGDTIRCCDAQGRIAVNGTPLEEGAYVPDEAGIECRGPMTGDCRWQAGPVPAGTIFVLGDNRGHSPEDSSGHLCLEDDPGCRDVPYVDADLVVGKLLVRYWPLGRIGAPEDTDAFDDVPSAS